MSLRTVLFAALFILACLLESSVRGEALPPGVRARLGTTRFRVGDTRNCLALSPDGNVLATGGGSSLRFWNRQSGEQLRCVGLPVLSLLAVYFSPDGRSFAAIGDHQSLINRRLGRANDFSVFVGSVAEGQVFHPFRGEYSCADFSVSSS
jgi:WD40 repeat protein